MSSSTPVQQSIEHKLRQSLAPQVLEIVNESASHNVPPGSESHFKLTVVSEHFQGLSKVKRQQSVYRILAEELAAEVHALTMQTFSPEEWAQQPRPSQSPPCLGGEKSR